MTSAKLLFNVDQLNRLFPFYILIDENLNIDAYGNKLEELCKGYQGKAFSDCFQIKSPEIPITGIGSLKTLQNQKIVLEATNGQKATLDGYFEVLQESNHVLFISSTGLNSFEQVEDSQNKLLEIIKTQEIANDELKKSLDTITRRNNHLKKTAEGIHDVALLSMQNPDPLFRIGTNGKVMMKNPAAEELNKFIYNGNICSCEDFWANISREQSSQTDQFEFEATSGNRTYYFICKYPNERDYFNVYGRDITQQKKHEDDLLRLSVIASSNENGVLFTYANGEIFWANEGFCRLTGFSLKEIIGKTTLDFCKGPLTDSTLLQSIGAEIGKRESFDTELVHYRKDGSWFWGRAKGQSYRTAGSNELQYFAIVEDISLEKEKEEQLQVLSKIAEDNINAVIITDKHGCINWVNKSFTKLTGYTLNEVYNKKPGNLLQGPNTEKKTVAYLKKQIASGETFNAEILNYSKKEVPYWVRIQGQPIHNSSGELTGFFAIEENITIEKEVLERIKESEARFRMALEKIGDNVWERDFRTKTTVISNTNNEFGFTSYKLINDEEVGWTSVFIDDQHLLKENDVKYKNREIDSHSLEYRMINTEGEIKWVLDRGVVIEKDEADNPLRIIGTHLDITGQKKQELELIEARVQAEQLARTKEVFLANMSHEIRTPMNAIMGMSNQLAKSNLNTQQQFYLGVIQSAADNLLVIINDILDLSKIEAGKLSLETIGFEPKAVAIMAMRVLGHKAEERGLKLTNSYFDMRISRVLLGDPHRINQVLLNLMSNAIKFTEKGSVDLSFKLLKDSKDSQLIEVVVRDTGIGMEESFKEHLFDKFSQEYESVTRNYGGTGLGMSICKDLIELMGGQIEVETKKGIGTTVSFYVELKKGLYIDLPEKVTVNIDDDFLSGKKILIADDNDMNRLVASIFLENYGAEIINAANGQQAIDEFESKNPDVILMDIQMPILNGFESTQMIRKLSKTIPIIALTANAIRGENEKCLAAGMNDYVSKPFKEEDLLKTIARWLGKEVTLIKVEETITKENEGLPYDLSSLKTISRGNEAFVEKMVNMFCDQTPQMVEEMKSAYYVHDLEKMSAIAHKIKPSIDNLKIVSLQQVVRDIENTGKQKADDPDMPEILNETERIIAKVIQLMREEYPAK